MAEGEEVEGDEHDEEFEDEEEQEEPEPDIPVLVIADLTDEARERITGCEDRQQIETWIVRAQSIKDIDELFD